MISFRFNRSGMSGCFPSCRLQKCMPTAFFTVYSGRNSSIFNPYVRAYRVHTYRHILQRSCSLQRADLRTRVIIIMPIDISSVQVNDKMCIYFIKIMSMTKKYFTLRDAKRFSSTPTLFSQIFFYCFPLFLSCYCLFNNNKNHWNTHTHLHSLVQFDYMLTFQQLGLENRL